MSYQVYGRIFIDEIDRNKTRDSSSHVVNLYTDCDDDIFKVLFCNSPRGHWVCHRLCWAVEFSTCIFGIV
jgi:hypothetical protein